MTMFPAEWPDNCPPIEAISADLIVYRIAKTSPPTPDDFVTYREMKKPDHGRPCDAAALSVFTNKDDAKHYSDKYQYLGEFIATGKLGPTHGKIMRNPRTLRGGKIVAHASWWAYLDVDRCALFVVD